MFILVHVIVAWQFRKASTVFFSSSPFPAENILSRISEPLYMPIKWIMIRKHFRNNEFVNLYGVAEFFAVLLPTTLPSSRKYLWCLRSQDSWFIVFILALKFPNSSDFILADLSFFPLLFYNTMKDFMSNKMLGMYTMCLKINISLESCTCFCMFTNNKNINFT